MKIPDRVVAAAQEKLGYLHHDSIMRADITAALEEWIRSGEAEHVVENADGSTISKTRTWTAAELPALIARLEAAEARAMIKTALEGK